MNKEIMETNFNEIAKQIHAGNVARGFDGNIEKGTALMLVVSELAEALEADRNNRYANKNQYIKDMQSPISEHEAANQTEIFKYYFEQHIKDTFEDEITDAMIRLFNLAGLYNIDLDFHIREKLTYNATREFKHGKKY